MNSLHIIGNLTADPEVRTTRDGKEVCSFIIAVNRPRRNGEDQGADYFKVSAWGENGKNCSKYLCKGKKASVVGPVSVRAYKNSKDEASASMEVYAKEVEFLTPRSAGTVVNDPDDPFGGMAG